MKIGDLARATGVNTRLLRYYEEQGLLTPERAGRGHRRYADDAPEIVAYIRLLLAAGLSTNVIRQLLPCAEGPELGLQQCAAPILREQLGTLDYKISALQHARTALTRILAETDPDTDEQPDDRLNTRAATGPLA